MITLFLQGLLVGFAIAAPVGPIGILCIQRSLQDGFRIGLWTGLGAATADTFYGAMAAFGLTAISSLLTAHENVIRLVGAAFLLLIGIRSLIAHSQQNIKPSETEPSAWHAYFSTFFLTLSNPATILSFIAIFAALGLGTEDREYSEALILVISISIGSTIWWLLLSGGVAYVLNRWMNASIMRWVNITSGLILCVFGVFVLYLTI